MTGSLSAATDFTLLEFSCNGSVWECSSKEAVLLSNSLESHNGISWGRVHDFNFYEIFLSEDNEEILASTDLRTYKKTEIFNLHSLTDKDHEPIFIGYVDDDWILFSAYYFDEGKLPNKKKKKIQLYEFNRNQKTVKKLPVDGIADFKFSVLNDRVYYTGEDGAIFEYSNGTSRDLGIIGWGASISPDGNKLAFRRTGLLYEKVYIYDMNNMTTASIIKFFGHNSINPVLRWSYDSSLIAVQKNGGLGAYPLFVIDASSSEILKKFEVDRACNWFFLTP